MISFVTMAFDSSSPFLKSLHSFLKTFPIHLPKRFLFPDSSGTLFRSNSPASKIITSFTFIIGMPYLYNTLSPFVKETASNANNVEVDTNKVKQDDDLNLNKFVFLALFFLFLVYFLFFSFFIFFPFLSFFLFGSTSNQPSKQSTE